MQRERQQAGIVTTRTLFILLSLGLYAGATTTMGVMMACSASSTSARVGPAMTTGFALFFPLQNKTKKSIQLTTLISYNANNNCLYYPFYGIGMSQTPTLKLLPYMSTVIRDICTFFLSFCSIWNIIILGEYYE